jgi:16S rRNA (cytosine1402-N4)-methyltransferase
VPEWIHKSVLLKEVLEALMPRSGGRYVDGTLGLAGHAAAILRASAPTGWLLGLDQDGEALARAGERLAEFAGRFELGRENFGSMDRRIGPGTCDGVLLDLGVSSLQLDDPARGFSFQQDGPLDMRMDDRSPETAASLVNRLDESELTRLFWEWGEEPQGRRMARAIVSERQKCRLESTGQLARIIERYAPRHGRKRHPATRVFQALRMAVNHETNSLKSGLAAACTVLAPRGRLVVITFHSIEDRIVKRWGIEASRDYSFEGEHDLPELRKPRPPVMKWIVKKPMTPGDSELESNPRARSAKMRVLEKI